ncbi:gene transfer agent family protein [Pacificimonas sp. WHA3]|uniref:Gene transfer agent family protein n=1 Tax=Pacificimonas pallii TaxID=2827236 RepID=A0ABS6SA23_9SPHN|nr:gene transfer agent family protein [Pacificimonas pallii]MBV7255204.1 gene transfer agent family protein [Pacificimonas pallii]
MTPNPVRGEALLELGGTDVLLRPSFSALCAAEAELGPLFGLVERAAAGELRLTEMAALFWHCSCGFAEDRDRFSEALIEGGLAGATPALKALLTQILAGR